MRLAALATAILLAGAGAQAAPDGAALFSRCAACHLAKGEGAPGMFPSLHAQVARFARAPAGREYLVSVVTHGAAGAITVGGESYDGFMPAQGLGDAEAAAVLTYLATSIAGAPASTAFTPAEVAAIRARHAGASAQDSHALRPNALAGK